MTKTRRALLRLSRRPLPRWLGLSVSLLVTPGAGAQNQGARGTPPVSSLCRIEGRVSSGSVPLPGVSIAVNVAGALKGATSTDGDGRYSIGVVADATYELSALFTGFTTGRHELAVGGSPCDQKIDFELALLPRAGAAPESPRPQRPTGAARSASTERPTLPQRFQTLNGQPDAIASNAVDVPPAQEAEDVSRLLPPGFSLSYAQADAIAVRGGGDATNLDRGLMSGRANIINLGQLDPATGQFAPGFEPPDGIAGGAFGAGRFPGGAGGSGGRGGGFGGRDGFLLGGRRAAGQRPYQGSATYTCGGSALDSPPYQLRADVPDIQPRLAQNTFGGTFGGPLKIPGLYANANRRTNFQLNFTGVQ